MRKYIGGFLVFVSMIATVRADLASDIIPSQDTTVINGDTGAGIGLLDSFLNFVKDSIFGLLGLITIGMFLYIGFRLVKAEGNPEELKKTFSSLFYVILGLFVVAISWALIKIISGVSF